MIEYCPKCKKDIERRPNACGCGFCPNNCGHRFYCFPPFELTKEIKLNMPIFKSFCDYLEELDKPEYII